jgi:large subunit ribosomal protein L10
VERAEKREFVTELNEVFKASGSVVVAHYAGATVAQMNDFRSKMRAAGGTVKVAKNRLAKIALQGTEAEGISGLFTGQTLIAYSNDPITAPKVVVDFAKTNDKIVVLGGAMGTTTLNADAVKSLATLPSLDELRAKAAGHDPDTGYPHRRRCCSTGKPACSRVFGLRQEGRSRIRRFFAVYKQPVRTEQKELITWLISQRS